MTHKNNSENETHNMVQKIRSTKITLTKMLCYTKKVQKWPTHNETHKNDSKNRSQK